MLRELRQRGEGFLDRKERGVTEIPPNGVDAKRPAAAEKLCLIKADARLDPQGPTEEIPRSADSPQQAARKMERPEFLPCRLPGELDEFAQTTIISVGDIPDAVAHGVRRFGGKQDGMGEVGCGGHRGQSLGRRQRKPAA